MGTRTGVNASVKGEGLVFAEVTGYDTQRDVALLTFQSEGSSPKVAELLQDFIVETGTELGFRLVEKLGYEVTVIGYAPTISETTPIATFGRIGVIWNVVPGDIREGQIDAAATGGMSGGGVFNTYGELIGILLSTWSPGFEGNSRYLSYLEINEVIEDLRSGVKR